MINQILLDSPLFISQSKPLMIKLNTAKKNGLNHLDYQLKFYGEMTFSFKTHIVKKFPFPVYKGEKFCKESVLFISLEAKYKILYTNNVLSFGNYLEDDLSQNIYKRLLKNLCYTMLSFKKRLSDVKTNKEKLYLTECYWDIANKTGGGGIIKNIFNIPYILDDKSFY